jgi:Xaa-Pro aminopeptidase
MTGLARVLAEMERRDVDVLLLGREPNARFVSGAARLYLAGERAFAPGCVVVRATGAVHLLSVGDAGIPAEVRRENLYPISWNPATLAGHLVAMPGAQGARRVGADGLTPLFEQVVAGCFPAAELVDGEALLRDVRRVKTGDEIAAVRAAVDLAERVMRAARDGARSGATERAVVAIAMEAMAREGVTTAAFEPIVRRDGDLVAIDIGVLRDGWEGGLARTEPGSAPPSAHAAAIARCVPGTRARSVAPQGVAHGVGIGYEVLEPDADLLPHMVLSVQHGNVRDLVVVSEDGAPEVLTRAPYE